MFKIEGFYGLIIVCTQKKKHTRHIYSHRVQTTNSITRKARIHSITVSVRAYTV